jgi:hypothetical protein
MGTEELNQIHQTKRRRSSKKRGNAELDLDDLTLLIIQIYFIEQGLDARKYNKYMNKRYPGINLRTQQNKFKKDIADKRAIKKQLMETDLPGLSTLYKSLQRFYHKTTS